MKKCGSSLIRTLPTTVDLEIFTVKNIFVVVQTTKIKNKKYILQQIIITVSTFRTHGFTAQLYM